MTLFWQALNPYTNMIPPSLVHKRMAKARPTGNALEAALLIYSAGLIFSPQTPIYQAAAKPSAASSRQTRPCVTLV